MRRTLLFLFFFFFYSFQGIADTCQVDIEKFCQGEKEPSTCLLRNERFLSDPCKQKLQRVSKVVKDAAPRTGSGLSSFGNVMGGVGLIPAQKTVINTNGALAPEERPAGITQSRFSIATPVWKKDGDSFSLSLNSSQIAFDERQRFENGDKSPGQLTRLELGGQYGKMLENKRFLGVRATVGSASDRPFFSKDEVTFSLNSFYTFPSKDGNQWVYTLFISNNNPLLNFIPIPGFIYFYRKDTFTGMFGLPFMSMNWTPVDPWMFSVSFFITNLNTEIAYGHRDKFQTFTGFAINQQSFLRKDREEKDHRLFFNEKRLFVGVRSPFTKMVSAELQSGLTFDRALKEGERFNDTDLESNFDRSWYASLSLNFLL